MIKVGEVIAVNGLKVTLRMQDESNKDTHYYNGKKFKGVAIREYISIQRGFRDIICIVEGEYLDEKRFIEESAKTNYIRKVDIKPIGFFESGKFNEGIKYLPMIEDACFLVSEDQLKIIYGGSSDDSFVIGEMLKEEIPISLPWSKLFNSHIGIFGNTGSGKSNTLAKLYTTLFDNFKESMRGKSSFTLIDFNGEYTTDQIATADDKVVHKLNTGNGTSDKYVIDESEVWNTEVLSILFQATQNTQRPFLSRLVTGRERFKNIPNSLNRFFAKTFERVFSSASPKPEALDQLKAAISLIEDQVLADLISQVYFHNGAQKFALSSQVMFQANGATYDTQFRATVNNTNIKLDALDEILFRAHLQLINDLTLGYVQFEHIQPLLKRVESALSSLKKVLSIGHGTHNIGKMLTVVSLRKCNQDIKKVMPLLIAKSLYHQHRNSVETPPKNTLHLIIDEAHNILSHQSSRESESWKDYRLELFEEIIKEGRKFGIYLTLSSQRPADISSTIVSQVHNFFIHRLVNDRDLFLMENTVSTLDSMSRSLIPNLPKGGCIATGTAFDLPMVLQVYPLGKDKQPDSEDVDLIKLWS